MRHSKKRRTRNTVTILMSPKRGLHIFVMILLLEINEIMGDEFFCTVVRMFSLTFYILVHAESCNGATVRNGTSQTIVDADNNVWSTGLDTRIYKNNIQDSTTCAVILLVYWNHTVYQQNNQKDWWQWSKTTPSWIVANSSPPPTNITENCTVPQTTAVSTSKLLTSTKMATSSAETTKLTAIYSTAKLLTSTKTSRSSVETTKLTSLYSAAKLLTSTETSVTSIGATPPIPLNSTAELFISAHTSTIHIETTHALTPELTSADPTAEIPRNASVLVPCPNTTSIGIHCSVVNNLCTLLQPCQNNGSCTNENDNYTCTCPWDFNGTRCQLDHRPCKPDTCWNDGK